MKVLLHACCGPCSLYPVAALREEGIDLALHFYNPNIHPYQEFERRLNALQEAARALDAPLTIDERYHPESWLAEVLQEEEHRCAVCYRIRLMAAASEAKQKGFDAFTTTILYSRMQKHDLCRDLGEMVAEQVGVPFLYRDFRVGWKAGIKHSKELGLYRQQYCGCIFSERDRFLGTPGSKKNPHGDGQEENR